MTWPKKVALSLRDRGRERKQDARFQQTLIRHRRSLHDALPVAERQGYLETA